METVDYIVSYLVTNIVPLPWIVKGPGLGLIVLLVLRALSRLLSLRLIGSATNIVYALIIGLIMARYGTDIAAYIEEQQADPEIMETQQQN